MRKNSSSPGFKPQGLVSWKSSMQSTTLMYLYERDEDTCQKIWITPLTASGKGCPDPAFPLLLHENHASCTFLHHSPKSSIFFPQKYKRPISAQANKCKMYIGPFDWYCTLNLHMLRLPQKRNGFSYLSMKKSMIACSVTAHRWTKHNICIYYSTNCDVAHIWSWSDCYPSSVHDRYPALYVSYDD